MKNFKKVLALVLVVATLLSFATVASAATSASYTDADKVTRTAAVDVLSYIGVLNGYTDKTFRPQGEITRAEAAKIIAMFDNGSSAINGLYASANPFTDCVGHWAESSIAYCYKMGIIDGVGNLKFDPESNVTGVQFLKMALIVLGYNAQKEGLTGASWAVNTLSLAKKAGLLAGLGYSYDYAANLVREDAAQIMLNALNSEIVDYGYEQKTGFVTVAGAVVVKDKYLKGQWGIDSSAYTDAFERPGMKYTCNGKTIATYLLTPEVTYTTKVSECKLVEDLGVAKTDITTALAVEAFRNGGHKTTDTLKHYSDNECRKAPLANTHQGTLTEVYDVSNWNGDHGTATYRIVSIDTWLANVDAVKPTTLNRVGHLQAGTPELTISTYEPENRDTTADNDNVHNNNGTCTGKLTTHTWKLAKEGFTKGDKVLVTYSNKTNAVESIELAKFENAQLTGFDHTDDCDSRVVGVAGATKNEAWKFEMGYNLLTKNNVGTAKAFYYDAYGNVIGMGKPVTDVAAEYAVVDATYYLIEAGKGSANGTMVGLDAKSADVKVAAIDRIKYVDGSVFGSDTFGEGTAPVSYSDFSRYIKSSSRAEGWAGVNADNYISAEGKVKGNEWAYDVLYTTSVDAYGRYTFKYVGELYDNDTVATIDAGDKNLYIDGVKTKALNAATQVLIHENDLSYTATTVAELGSISATGVQVVDANGDGYADILYLFGTIIRKGESLVGYVADWTNPQYQLVGSNAYYVYNVYFDGVRTPVYFDADQAAYKTAGVYDFDFISGEDKIVYANATANAATVYSKYYASLNADKTGMIIANDSELTDKDAGSMNFADSIKVYYVDGNTVATTQFDLVDVATFDTLIAGDAITYTVNAAGQVTAIYIVTDANA